MIARLEGTYGFSKAWEDNHVVELITLIKGIFCHFNNQQQAIWSVVQAKKRVFLLIQSKYLSTNKYYDKFKVLVAVVETHGRTFVKPGIIEEELADAGVLAKHHGNGVSLPLIESANKTALDGAIKTAREKILALMLLNGANHMQHAKVRNHLAN